MMMKMMMMMMMMMITMRREQCMYVRVCVCVCVVCVRGIHTGQGTDDGGIVRECVLHCEIPQCSSRPWRRARW